MRVIRKIGFPISLVYALVVFLRNYLYDIGFISATSFKTPTICVGNLSVGGTGKTPIIEFLISKLKGSYSLAVLSRGYKRKSKGFVLADETTSVEHLGDEPFQIYSKFSDITVAVDSNRANGITNLESRIKPQLILLDDAFQHRKVIYGFSILLTDYSNLYVDDWYLPTGELRDSRKEAKRASVIVVAKCPESLKESEQERIKEKLNTAIHQRVLFSYLDYNTALQGDSKVRELRDLKGNKITVITGIAKPKPFISFLESEGILVEHLKYNDHHFFTQEEIDLFNTKKLVLTTEKDFVRLRGKVNNLFYLAISHKFHGDGEAQLMKAIANFMR